MASALFNGLTSAAALGLGAIDGTRYMYQWGVLGSALMVVVVIILIWNGFDISPTTWIVVLVMLAGAAYSGYHIYLNSPYGLAYQARDLAINTAMNAAKEMTAPERSPYVQPLPASQQQYQPQPFQAAPQPFQAAPQPFQAAPQPFQAAPQPRVTSPPMADIQYNPQQAVGGAFPSLIAAAAQQASDKLLEVASEVRQIAQHEQAIHKHYEAASTDTEAERAQYAADVPAIQADDKLFNKVERNIGYAEQALGFLGIRKAQE